MVTFFVILSLLAILIIWVSIDIKKGISLQKKNAKKYNQETRYSHLTLLPTGEKLFKTYFQDIEQASHHIHILFYIIKDDNIGNKMINILKNKARQGVTVRLLVDKMGCNLKKGTIDDLKKAGVLFSYSHPMKLPYLFFTLNRRNHRKITVIDGHIGYTGGFNVGNEYLGRNPKFGSWRDYHLRLEGDGVQDLQGQFIQDWTAARKENLKSDVYFPPLTKGPSAVRIMPTDGAFLEDCFLDFIRQAKKKLTIATPYYIPGRALQGEVLAAAKRGVDINLIVPKKPDHPLVKEAAFPYFNDLLQSDINIFQYYRGFYHSKVILVDDQLCDIGTANFDKRSLHLNHEINCLIYDKDFIKTVYKEIEYDISISERLTLHEYEKRSLLHKGKEKFATLVSPLL